MKALFQALKGRRFGMTIENAGHIEFAQYTCQKEFNDLCLYAITQGICEGPEFVYTALDGTPKDISILVRKAEFANSAQKSVQGPASLMFVLSFVCSFIDFERINKEALRLAKKYNTVYHSNIGEREAMAAVLMVLIGYEQRKLCIMRKCVEQRKKQNNTSLCWRLSTVKEFEQYHVDIVGTPYTDETDIQAASQIESELEYFDLLEYQKESEKLTEKKKLNIDNNRKQLNRFLDDFPNVEVQLLTYQLNEERKYQMRSYGIYKRVKSIF